MRNQALPGKIYDANNGLTYALHGDYYLPLIEAPQDDRPIGKYGRMRKKYLIEHRPVLYNQLVFTGKLLEHLIEVNECCNRYAAGASGLLWTVLFQMIFPSFVL